MFKLLFSALMSLTLVMPAVVRAADETPDALVRKVTDDTLAAVRGDKDIHAGNRDKLLALVDQKVLPYFDFTRMTMWAMGRSNWTQATPDQQQTIVTEFRKLLVYTYASAFASYKDQTIDVKPAQFDADGVRAEVQTFINQPGGQPVEVDYDMYKSADGWKAYDVIIAGVRLAQNYRTTFNDEIQRDGIDGLIKMLQDKNKSLAAAK